MSHCRLPITLKTEKHCSGNMTNLFWVVPVEVERNFLNISISRSRQVDDVLEFIGQFERYPSLQFIDNLASKIERNKVGKEEMTKLV